MKSRSLPFVFTAVGLTLFGLALPFTAQAQTSVSCNQLGREIALRATEEEIGSLNDDDRSQLAQLAATVCDEFLAAAPAASSTPVAPAASAPAAAAEAEAAEPKRELFDLDIIDPEDRVQRPGLKRR